MAYTFSSSLSLDRNDLCDVSGLLVLSNCFFDSVFKIDFLATGGATIGVILLFVRRSDALLLLRAVEQETKRKRDINY